MLVYRVENDKKQGPYCSGFARWLLDKGHRNQNTHPEPGYDGLEIEHGSVMVCGCTSYIGLIKWFNGCGAKLVKEGYKCVLYDVHDDFVAVGDSGVQCIFNPHQADKIEEIEDEEFAEV